MQQHLYILWTKIRNILTNGWKGLTNFGAFCTCNTNQVQRICTEDSQITTPHDVINSVPLPVTLSTIMSTIFNFFKPMDVYDFALVLHRFFSTCVLPVVPIQEIAKTPKSSKFHMNVQLWAPIHGFKVDTIVLVSTHAPMEMLVFNAHGFSPTDDHQPPHVT